MLPVHRRLDRPQGQSGRFVKERNFVPARNGTLVGWLLGVLVGWSSC